MEIEQGTFTPLVFTTTGGMVDECVTLVVSTTADLRSRLKIRREKVIQAQFPG